MNHTISFDEKGICIDSSYRILLASSLFYFRIPREKWKARMLLLKAAGYNTIDVYFPWNYHETQPGQWDFTGCRDIDRFLTLAAECGLWVIARPGPYICSEWDGGALPAWLSAAGVPVRQDEPSFLSRIMCWYEHVLPLIAPHQAALGGTVICMQIENELDFFDCKSPVSYMEKLMQAARRLKIDVPLFYCCGQNDLLRAGGLTEGLITAFNVYDDAASSGLEARAMHLHRMAGERRQPLLVTETNREHSFLKRLFACGAKLLSPYNQTAGTTMDWYNGMTNWGTDENPLALMASDYDFNSMIGSAGEVNGQFYEARLLSGLLDSFGEALASAVPRPAFEVSISAEGSCRETPMLLEMDRGGFLEAVNTGPDCLMKLVSDRFSCSLTMPALTAKLLPWRLPLSEKDGPVLEGCNYEIGWLVRQDGKITAGMYGEGPFHAALRFGDRLQTLSAMPDVTAAAQEPARLTAGNVTFLYGPASLMAKRVPGLPDLKIPVEKQETGEAVSECRTAPLLLLPAADSAKDNADTAGRCCLAIRQKPSEILPMEKLGQYRGIGCYSFYLDKTADVLFQNAADLLTRYHNGVYCGADFSAGGCRRLTLNKGTHDVITEIWGHSNFDDIRVNSLRMGSLKGLSGVFVITAAETVSRNWDFDLDREPVESWYSFRPSGFSAVMDIDGYNRAASPVQTVYHKWLPVPENADAMLLHFSKADCLIRVYVNGHLEGTVSKSDPYVDISRFTDCRRVEICLRVQRRYYTDPVGEVTLLTGNRLKGCLYGAVPIQEAALPKDAVCTKLPLRLTQENQLLFSPILKESDGRDRKLYFKGRDLKLTALLNGRVIGRLALQNNTLPTVAGGRSDVLYLPAEWPADRLIIWCQPIGPEPELNAVRVTAFTPVV